MSHIKNTLVNLCDTINMCCQDNILKIEYFFPNFTEDNSSEAVISFTNIVEQLANIIVIKNLGHPLGIQNIEDNSLRVKLLMAYLDYPLPDLFLVLNYSNTTKLNSLMLAFGWLIVEHNALEHFVNSKLNYAELQEDKFKKIYNDSRHRKSTSNHIDSLMKDYGILSHNVKQISELLKAKAKLNDKVHITTENILGVGHLSIGELSLIKSIAENRNESAEWHTKYLKKLRQQAIIMDNYLKFKKNIVYFIKWIVSNQKNREKLHLTHNLEEALEFYNVIARLIKSNLDPKKNHSKPNFSDTGTMQLVKVGNDLAKTDVLLLKLKDVVSKSTVDLKNQLKILAEEFVNVF